MPWLIGGQNDGLWQNTVPQSDINVSGISHDLSAVTRLFKTKMPRWQIRLSVKLNYIIFAKNFRICSTV